MYNDPFSQVKYLAEDDAGAHWGLAVTTAGFQSISPHSGYPPQGHPSPYRFHPARGRVLPEYQLVYVTRGAGLFTSRHAGPVELKAGALMVLFPDEWHTYYPDTKSGWDTYWVGFKGSFPGSDPCHRFFSEKEPVYQVGLNEQLVDLFRQSIDLAQLERTGYQEIIAGVLMHLLGLVYYINRNRPVDDEMQSRMEHARMIMRQHPGGTISPESIAASLNMSYSWFRKMFRKYTGFAPAQYQLQLKLLEAKKMLVHSTRPVKEIAFLLDFESVNYFTVFFRQKTSLTPTAYREKYYGRPEGTEE
ncbi:AraC family transcriptional regulator [Compostibacter hankyongensis]|uniref:AraC family transcriptional regulator n=1 Tax=Compostibacter hankyongensis TaxID=1007089 RepID=A0ABP8FMA6_9BACT